jgi:peroxiredoxin
MAAFAGRWVPVYPNGGIAPVKIFRRKMEEGRWKRSFSSFFLLPSSILLFALSGCSGLIVPGGSVGTELTQEQRFTLKGLKNEAISLDQLLAQNKAVLVNFWATWCTYCVEEMPELIKLQKKDFPRGFTVLAVNVGESQAQAAMFAEKMQMNFPVALDEDTAVSRAYGLVGIPTTFLINAQGKVIGEYHSYDPKLERDVEQALSS